MTAIQSALVFASQRFPQLSSRVLASSGYTLDPDRLAPPERFGVWTAATALRQDRAWRPIVAAAKAGAPREDVASLARALASVGGTDMGVLEVGCGGGYNSELIEFAFPDIHYAGLDISPAMIELARLHYPGRTFEEGSAYDLPQPAESVDIVLDGVALIHMPGWQAAIAEYARVARRAVVLHGVTLTDSAPTTRFAKFAYGQPAIEFVFNRTELLERVNGLGLTVEETFAGLDYDLQAYLGIPSVSETWVLRAAG